MSYLQTSTQKAGEPCLGDRYQGTQSLAGARGVLAHSLLLQMGRRPARSMMSGCQLLALDDNRIVM